MKTEAETTAEAAANTAPIIKDTTDTASQTTEARLLFTKSFTVEHTDENGKHLIGTFSARRLTLGLRGQMGVIHARLNGGEAVDPQTDNMHAMMAYCAVAITASPSWWTPEEFYEGTLLASVHNYVRQWEIAFRRKPVG